MKPTDDAPFTTGEFSVPIGSFVQSKDGSCTVEIRGQVFSVNCATAHLIASALNAATSLHHAGYDAQKVFERLSEIMDILSMRNPNFGQDLRRKPKP